MTTLWSHTFVNYTDVDSLPQTFDAVGQLSPDAGATHATVSSITVMFYKPSVQGTYNMQCRIMGLGSVWSDYSYEDVIWAGETTQIITFTFADVVAEIAGLDFEIQLSKNSGPAYTTYIARDGDNFLWDNDTYFIIIGEWIGAYPSKPTNPTPANGATGVDFSGLVLDWVDGGGADTFDVYIGPSGSLVEVASAIVPSTYTVSIGDVPTEQVIYWRVDATNASGTTTGDTWNFDARPVKAITPSPTDTGTGITLDETPLSWVDGGNTDTYEIYFRESGDAWVLVGIAQAGLTWAVSFGTLAYGTTYEWRVDATNVYGTTTGTTWSFDTIDFDQIRVSYRLISGGSGAGPYDSPPGVEGTDWAWTGESNMLAVRRLIAAANSKIWYESI